MAKKGYSQRNVFGGYTHYDSKGRKTGSSQPSLFGGYTHYDAKGHKTGTTQPGAFGGYRHYDAKGHRTGTTQPGMMGSYNHYDKAGHKVGSSDPGVFNAYRHSDTGGCYIATCIYGSYDCPQVWTLRRFRDGTLAKSIGGRIFIRFYYAVSPTVVKYFGQTQWFRCFWRSRLDFLVQHLQQNGVADTPYQDRIW